MSLNGGCRESNRPSGKLGRPAPSTAHRHANVVLSPYGCRTPVYIASQPRARMRWGKALSSPNATISHNLRRAAVGHLLIATQKATKHRGTDCLLTAVPDARRLQRSRMRVCKRNALSPLWHLGALLLQTKALMDIGRLNCRSCWSVVIGCHSVVACHSMAVAGKVTAQVVSCAVLPRTPPIGMLMLFCLHTTAAPHLSRARGCDGASH